MAHLRRHDTRKAADPREIVGATLAPSGPVVPVAIDLDDLQEARKDEKLSSLLASAEAEGASVEREGRQRW
jgi:hypothetical protein